MRYHEIVSPSNAKCEAIENINEISFVAFNERSSLSDLISGATRLSSDLFTKQLSAGDSVYYFGTASSIQCYVVIEEDGGSNSWLMELWTDPKHRKTGLAAKLVLKMIELKTNLFVDPKLTRASAAMIEKLINIKAVKASIANMSNGTITPYNPATDSNMALYDEPIFGTKRPCYDDSRSIEYCLDVAKGMTVTNFSYPNRCDDVEVLADEVACSMHVDQISLIKLLHRFSSDSANYEEIIIGTCAVHVLRLNGQFSSAVISTKNDNVGIWIQDIFTFQTHRNKGSPCQLLRKMIGGNQCIWVHPNLKGNMAHLIEEMIEKRVVSAHIADFYDNVVRSYNRKTDQNIPIYEKEYKGIDRPAIEPTRNGGITWKLDFSSTVSDFLAGRSKDIKYIDIPKQITFVDLLRESF